MPSSKAAKKKQRQKKAAAEKNMVVPEMTKEGITSMVSSLEPKSYEQIIVYAAQNYGGVADTIIAHHESLLKIRAHEETLVLDFAKMAKAINRSLNAKYWEILDSATAENRNVLVRKYAKKLVNDIDAALNYMTAEVTSDSLYSTKFAALDGIRSVLESILRGPKPLQNAMSRLSALQKWDVKVMVVLKHFNITEMCKLKCGQFGCGEQETPTQWMKDMKRLCLLHEVADKKLFGHWIDDAFEFGYDRAQAAKIPDAEKHEAAIRGKGPPVSSQTEASSSQGPSLEPDLAQPSGTVSSSEAPMTQGPSPKLRKEEIKNMVSPLFPSVLEEIMISTALAHPSVIRRHMLRHRIRGGRSYGYDSGC